MSFAASILDRYQRYGWSEPDGEWGKIYTGAARQELRRLLDAGDAKGMHQALMERFNAIVYDGLVTMLGDDAVGVFRRMGRTWRYMTGCLDLRHEPDMAVVDAPGTSGELLLDVLRHDHYAVQILRYVPRGQVMDIGGGYGGTALQLRRRSQDVQVVLCDLPETLYLAGFFLDVAGESVKWWDEEPNADVVLVPNCDLDAWGGKPALVLNAHSFSEMPLATARRYLDWIDANKVPYLYTDNAFGIVMSPVGNVPNSCELYPEVLQHDLVPPGPYMERWRRILNWSVECDRYMEVFYERCGA